MSFRDAGCGAERGSAPALPSLRPLGHLAFGARSRCRGNYQREEGPGRPRPSLYQ